MINLNNHTLQQALRIAKEESLSSDFHSAKLGAVIFNMHHIYASSHNSNKTNPLQAQYNKYKDKNCSSWKHSVHAEISCIHKFLQKYYLNLPQVNKLMILIYRQHKNGKYAMAKPCKICERALRNLGIKNIIYTGENSLIYEIYQ